MSSFNQQCAKCGSKDLRQMDAMFECRKCGHRLTECSGCVELDAEVTKVRAECDVWQEKFDKHANDTADDVTRDNGPLELIPEGDAPFSRAG